ncbi:hypothetical protein [Phenylobacterium sp.]|uniref:hypothetical protein n=1 Tax=Phenylobacterium sp. TaxID=1871053 RepID=UPI0035AEEE0A
MLRQAVTGAHRNGRHVGICGEAPATYPEIAAFLTSSASTRSASIRRACPAPWRWSARPRSA